MSKGHKADIFSDHPQFQEILNLVSVPVPDVGLVR